jgi:hypothetical protein
MYEASFKKRIIGKQIIMHPHLASHKISNVFLKPVYCKSEYKLEMMLE